MLRSKKNSRARMRVLLPLMLTLLLSLFGFARAQRLMRSYAGVSARLIDAPVSEKALCDAMALSGGSGGVSVAAAWTRGEAVEAVNESMQTRARLRVIAALGDMRQVCPLTLLSGSLPTARDTTGCVIDQESAMALFGSIDTRDASLIVGGQTYVLRGVIDGAERLLLCRRADATYENLEFLTDDCSIGKANVSAFLNQAKLSSDFAVIESGSYARIARGVSLLPLALLCALAATLLIVSGVRNRTRGGIHALLPLIFALALLCLAAFIVRQTFYLPQSFLPTKASDFAFWRDLLSALHADWQTLSLLTPLPKDVLFCRGMRSVLLFALAAGFTALMCLGACARLLQNDKP